MKEKQPKRVATKVSRTICKKEVSIKIWNKKSSLKECLDCSSPGFVDSFLPPFIQVSALRSPHWRDFPEPLSETLRLHPTPSIMLNPQLCFILFHNTCSYLILYFINCFCPSPPSRLNVQWEQQGLYMFCSLLSSCCSKPIVVIQSMFVKWREKEGRKKWKIHEWNTW